jgi:hypothetical protein
MNTSTARFVAPVAKCGSGACHEENLVYSPLASPLPPSRGELMPFA